MNGPIDHAAVERLADELQPTLDGIETARQGYRSAAIQRFALSPVRARIHLGWSPWTDLDEGVRSLSQQP